MIMTDEQKANITIAISIVRVIHGMGNLMDLKTLIAHVDELVDDKELVKKLHKAYHPPAKSTA